MIRSLYEPIKAQSLRLGSQYLRPTTTPSRPVGRKWIGDQLKSHRHASQDTETGRIGLSGHGSERFVQPHPVTNVNSTSKKIVVAITGATGTIYATRILRVLRDLGHETHLVISKWALATLKYETSATEEEIRRLAHVNYVAKDVSAPIASGSFQHDGMVIAPCSMKTLAAVRTGFCDDLISRAADVSLKEGRKLVMVVRETPLSDVHLDNMLFLRRAGAVIFPPVPAFYTRPQTLDDIIFQSVGRILDSLGIHTDDFERWNGFRKNTQEFTRH